MSTHEKGNGVVSKGTDHDTGPLSVRLRNFVTPEDIRPQLTPEAFLDALATKLAEKAVPPAPPAPPAERVLGIAKSDWVKFGIAYGAALVSAVVFWYLGVRDALAERPTRTDVSAEHTAIQANMEVIRNAQQLIRESLAGQAQWTVNTTATIGEMKIDLKALQNAPRHMKP